MLSIILEADHPIPGMFLGELVEELDQGRVPHAPGLLPDPEEPPVDLRRHQIVVLRQHLQGFNIFQPLLSALPPSLTSSP